MLPISVNYTLMSVTNWYVHKTISKRGHHKPTKDSLKYVQGKGEYEAFFCGKMDGLLENSVQDLANDPECISFIAAMFPNRLVFIRYCWVRKHTFYIVFFYTSQKIWYGL